MLFTWGYCDCREALRLHINELEQNGRFVRPWVKRKDGLVPCLFLTHWGDEKEIPNEHRAWSEMADRVYRERIVMLPADVREGMGIG